uniref:Uncharacterized protein n=1 Tax=Rhizophora mucronata TaxID=61149 RepID=A0A2P2MX69_RHIMU
MVELSKLVTTMVNVYGHLLIRADPTPDQLQIELLQFCLVSKGRSLC